MAPESVLVIHPDGTAAAVAWPVGETDRRAVVAAAVGPHSKMRRCGKGILGFSVDEASGEPIGRAVPRPNSDAVNHFAATAFAAQGVELDGELRGPVLFARNPSKGSVVMPLTAAQSANLLLVTGASLG
jgi:hypothetical protein